MHEVVGAVPVRHAGEVPQVDTVLPADSERRQPDAERCPGSGNARCCHRTISERFRIRYILLHSLAEFTFRCFCQLKGNVGGIYTADENMGGVYQRLGGVEPSHEPVQ